MQEVVHCRYQFKCDARSFVNEENQLRAVIILRRQWISHRRSHWWHLKPQRQNHRC
jgi:hypothetical protein